MVCNGHKMMPAVIPAAMGRGLHFLSLPPSSLGPLFLHSRPLRFRISCISSGVKT